MSWCQCKIAYLLTDKHPNLDEAVSNDSIWDMMHNSILPTGWEFTETDSSGARVVMVFEVDDTISQQDMDTVERLLETLEKQS